MNRLFLNPLIDLLHEQACAVSLHLPYKLLVGANYSVLCLEKVGELVAG